MALNVVPLPKKENFFEKYYSYIGLTEAPKIYNRWMAISMVGALLSRQTWLPFGHGTIYPNQYIWLVGIPGARKGTAIGPIKNLLRALKYEKTSPQRISPEMFLAQLQRLNLPKNLELLSDIQIEEMEFDAPCDMYVVADELGDFIRGNGDFVKVLTNLYDCLPVYEHPKLHGKSVSISQPTINIVGGITPEDITLCVPPETMGQGFFSRLILVHSEPSTVRITIPESPSQAAMDHVVNHLQEMKECVRGPMEIIPEAKQLLDQIYTKFPGIDFVNFQHYNSRRFTHLLKLCIIMAAIDFSTKILPHHVLQANTILYTAETRMPRALGEFGRAKNASVSHKIVECLKSVSRPLSIKEIWHHVHADLTRLEDLVTLIKGLEFAEKIQRLSLEGKTGFMPLYKEDSKWSKGLVIEDKDFLFPEERI